MVVNKKCYESGINIGDKATKEHFLEKFSHEKILCISVILRTAIDDSWESKRCGVVPVS